MTRFYATCLVTTQLSLIVSFAVGANLWLNPNTTSLTKKLNESFAVQCSISNTESSVEQSPSWTFKKDPLTQYQHLVMQQDGLTSVNNKNKYTANLMISKANFNHSGYYRCSAEFDGRSAEALLQIKIYQPVKLVDAPESQNPVQGTLAKIKCLVSGDPQPEIQWFKRVGAEDVFMDKTLDERYGFEDKNQILLIENFEKEKDDGLYKCQGNQFATADVAVQSIIVFGFVPPKVTTNSQSEVFENGDVNLVCTVTGIPEPIITWFKDGTILEASEKYSFPVLGTMHLTNGTPSDAGSYACKAVNDVGEDEAKIALKVIAKPTIAPIKKELAVLKGENHLVNCVYDYHDDEDTDTKKANWISEKLGLVKKYDSDFAAVMQANIYVAPIPNENILMLNITNASMKDEGKYQCVVSNRAASSVEEFVLIVEEAPVIDERSAKNVRTLNKQVSLFCAAEAKPIPSWKWTGTKGQALDYETDSDIVQLDISADGKSSTLHVTPSESVHYGTYKCTAENIRGTASESFEIVKIEVPEKPIFEIIDVHPNKAELKITNYDENSTFSKRPDVVYLKAMKDTDYDGSSVDSTMELHSSFPYNPKGQYFVRDLIPNRHYRISVYGRNEAGNSSWEMSNPYTTSPPGAPSKPIFITNDESYCDSTCPVEWETPDDRGSVITHYVIRYGAIKNSNVTDRDYGVEDWHQDRVPAAMHNKINLAGLKPSQSYVVRVNAENSEGSSPVSDDLIIRTRTVEYDDIISGKGGVGVGAVIAIVVVLILILILLIDVACYYVNQCGLLMCVCVNCCGKTPPEVKAKVVALEEGNLCTDEKKPIKDVEYNDAKEEANEHTPMIDSDKNQPKKDTTV